MVKYSAVRYAYNLLRDVPRALSLVAYNTETQKHCSIIAPTDLNEANHTLEKVSRMLNEGSERVKHLLNKFPPSFINKTEIAEAI